SKHLIIVPSGPLTNLPFHVLVTQPPDPALVAMARYRRAAWLALRQSVTVLPSVGSLQALRKLAPSQAKKPTSPLATRCSLVPLATTSALGTSKHADPTRRSWQGRGG